MECQIMTPSLAYLRGQITAAKGLSCLLKNDPLMVSSMVGLDNQVFANLQRKFSLGWNDGKEISDDLRAFSHQ